MLLGLLNSLWDSGCSMAAYRLPWSDKVHVLAQGGEARVFESLEDVRGFVFVPFSRGLESVVVEGERRWTLGAPRFEEGFVVDVERSEPSVGYALAFERFRGALRRGEFSKLVLSRCERHVLGGDFSVVDAFLGACACFPRVMVYLFRTAQTGTWIGCTPEVFLRSAGGRWQTTALAGTRRVGDGGGWDAKNREEQGYVVDFVREVLGRYAWDVEESAPYTARAGGLLHLKTDFSFMVDGIGELARALFPTPAVCGLPKEGAYDFIVRNEGYDRGYYSGLVGMVDGVLGTDLYVNLRCGRFDGGEAVLYAGGGILRESELEGEWGETSAKMQRGLLVVGSR